MTTTREIRPKAGAGSAREGLEANTCPFAGDLSTGSINLKNMVSLRNPVRHTI
jgi:hypothetical protein